MESDIYQACENGDIGFVQALLQTSLDDANINRLEPNGSTALHIACSKGYTNIVQLLLNEYQVQRHQRDKNGQTAYEITSSKEIRQLFHRPKHDNNPFCTNENTLNPLKVIENENCSDPRWIDVYPTDVPIRSECYFKVLDEQSINYRSIFDELKSLVGIDPHKKKIDKWCQNLRFHIKECLIEQFIKRNSQPNYKLYLNASKCIEEYEKSREIEHLFRLHTLDVSICRYFSQNIERINCLNQPIIFHLSSVYQRAYQGVCFRGLTMKENEFEKYKKAFLSKENYIKTNTFCSTSIDPSVAEMFTDTNQNKDIVNVLMIFEFVKSCSTALILFSSLPKLKSISNFEDEQEVLILPNTYFSVKDIQQNQLKIIHLEHYNTKDEEAEMHQERFRSYINSIVLEDSFIDITDF